VGVIHTRSEVAVPCYTNESHLLNADSPLVPSKRPRGLEFIEAQESAFERSDRGLAMHGNVERGIGEGELR
jgi:hypothetical protein